ncbi:MAG: M56 family metallopeptidase [Pseudonocardia sp.]
MEAAALALLLLGLALAEPVSVVLARAAWPARDPVGALLVWQAVGLAGGTALLGAGVVFALSPLGDSPAAAVGAFGSALVDLRLPAEMDTVHVLALVATIVLATRLLGVLVVTATRTLRMRRRHRDLVDVLGTAWSAAPGARVLDHPVPVAYCLPGWRSRLVLSAGVLDVLDAAELDAVLAHERAHLRERHDLVVLPFVAWGATAPFVRGMRNAQVSVAALVEMRADDVAVSQVRPIELARALKAVGGGAPAAALSSFADALGARQARILVPPAPLAPPLRALVRLGALGLVAAPALMLAFA